MRDIPKIIDVSVATLSTMPRCAIVEIETAGSTMAFELAEEIALRICTDLERFLTQEQRQRPATVQISP